MEQCILEHLFEHFNEEGHRRFLEDVSITFIDKTGPLEEPLKKVNYWKNVLKTMAPLVLNIEDSVWETFEGIMDGIILERVYGLRLLWLFIYLFIYRCMVIAQSSIPIKSLRKFLTVVSVCYYHKSFVRDARLSSKCAWN